MPAALVYNGPTVKTWDVTAAGAGAETETIAHGFVQNGAAVIPRDISIVPLVASFYARVPRLTLAGLTNVNIVVDMGAGGAAVATYRVNARIPHSEVR